METEVTNPQETLSPWWRRGALAIGLAGFAVLIWLTAKAYVDAPPIPEQVTGPDRQMLFIGNDILAGQQVFLKYGLMDNGSIWGHGAYLGPDFSAQYLHTLALDAGALISAQRFKRSEADLADVERSAVKGEVRFLLKQNRYNQETRTLAFTESEAVSFQRQIGQWRAYFQNPAGNGGLPAQYISDPEELRQLTAFFAWTAWASAANRPGKDYSYTNNFPYDSLAGNLPTADAVLWSALSLVFLLGGTALVLFAFGKFDYLGWKSTGAHHHPQLLPGEPTESQRATVKFFVVVALLFLAQTLVGGATAHYRADPASFYGIDLAAYLPSQILRTWHLQLAIFWIATAFVAGALFLAPALGRAEPKSQSKGVHLLFAALVVVVSCSLLGEWLGVNQLLKQLWFWFGHQGWEYLELGRAWQILLAVGLVFWLMLLVRAVGPALGDPERREMSTLYLIAAAAIPVFYLPAMFFDDSTHYSVVDAWRFWIIHLWVEGFFEFFVTVLVAIIFFLLGAVSRPTAIRIIYIDAMLYFAGGMIGTGHHWYWTGQSSMTLAFSALFSALEVVPLTLLTLDAWDFIKLTQSRCEICGKEISIPHKWTFYFLMAVGFWNFIGAGIFGFLINLSIVSYFEVGSILTPNHGHSALMGVFGMLAIALLVFALRNVLDDRQWGQVEKYIQVSFWGLNIGLVLMVALSLFPGGVMQLLDVLENGYWHARSLEYLSLERTRLWEWLRLPGDLIFILFGAVPLVIAAGLAYRSLRQSESWR